MNNIPVFCGRNVPISELAAAIGKVSSLYE